MLKKEESILDLFYDGKKTDLNTYLDNQNFVKEENAKKNRENFKRKIEFPKSFNGDCFYKKKGFTSEVIEIKEKDKKKMEDKKIKKIVKKGNSNYRKRWRKEIGDIEEKLKTKKIIINSRIKLVEDRKQKNKIRRTNIEENNSNENKQKLRKSIQLDKETKKIKEAIMRVRMKKKNELKEELSNEEKSKSDKNNSKKIINSKSKENNEINIAVIGPEQYKTDFINLTNSFWQEIDGFAIIYNYYGAWGHDEQQISIHSIIDNDIIVIGPNDHVWKDIPSQYNGKLDGIFQFINNKKNSKGKLICKYLYKAIPEGSKKRPKITKTILQKIIVKSITAYIMEKSDNDLI